MSTSGKYPDHLSLSASEIPSGEDIEAMIARLDQKWRELKKLLRAEEGYTDEEEQPPPGFPVGFTQMEAADDDSWWNSLQPLSKRHADVTVQEAEAIVEGVEKLDEETDIREQLVKIRWQNRGLIVYSVICTVMFLYLLLSVFFSNDSYALNQIRIAPAKEANLAAVSDLPIPVAASAPLIALAAAAGDAQTNPINDGGTPGYSQEISKTAPAPTQGEGASATGEVVTPKVEYVGSVTSNKYHYRSCKWAKFIIPRKERVFHSVAEARQAGYISCPTCRPPLTDEIQTTKR